MKKILFSTLSFIAGISVVAQNSATLKLNLEKNKPYRLKSVSEQTITQTVNGNQQTVDSKVNYIMSLKMIDFTPEFMITEVHFDTIVSTTNTMGKIISINSTAEGDIKSSETADIMSYIMNRLCSNAIYAKVDYSGKPLEIVNSKMLSDMILKDTSSVTLTGPVADAVKKQMGNTVSAENLKNLIGMFTWSLPDKQISVGQGWNITQQINTGGMMLNISTEYHLDGINGNNATVSGESDIRAVENAKPIQSGGATVTYDNLRGMSKLNMVIDISTGLVVESNTDSHIAGTLGVSAPGFSMDMPMDINGKTKTTSVR